MSRQQSSLSKNNFSDVMNTTVDKYVTNGKRGLSVSNVYSGTVDDLKRRAASTSKSVVRRNNDSIIHQKSGDRNSAKINNFISETMISHKQDKPPKQKLLLSKFTKIDFTSNKKKQEDKNNEENNNNDASDHNSAGSDWDWLREANSAAIFCIHWLIDRQTDKNELNLSLIISN